MRIALVLAALILGAAPALAQAPAATGIADPADAPVTLHLHLLDPFNDFAINTQPWQPLEDQPIGPPGLATSTMTCLPPVPGFNPGGYHTYYGFSTASYVEYGFAQDGRPRMWPERQLGYNTTLDAGVPPILTWYLMTTTGAPEGEQVPLVVPNVVVEATLRVSDSLSVDDKAYDSGFVVAHGRSAPALLAADATEGAEHSMAGDRHVYGFRVPLDLQQAAMGAVGYTLRIDVYLDNPACAAPAAGTTAMPNLVAPYIDEEHRPMVTAGVLDPLRILSLEPSFNGTTIEVRGVVQSAWGNYDVDEGNLTLMVDGPHSTIGPQPLPLQSIVQWTSAHYHHADPVVATWSWDRRDWPDGLYWLTFTASNDQHTANATATAAVRIGPDQSFPAGTEVLPPPKDAPAGPGAALALLAVLAAGLRRSRWATVMSNGHP